MSFQRTQLSNCFMWHHLAAIHCTYTNMNVQRLHFRVNIFAASPPPVLFFAINVISFTPTGSPINLFYIFNIYKVRSWEMGGRLQPGSCHSKILALNHVVEAFEKPQRCSRISRGSRSVFVSFFFAAMSMDHLQEPIWSNQPFTKKFPVPPQMSQAVCCGLCSGPIEQAMPKVRGIPHGSRPLPEEEEKDLLKKLEGQWSIQVQQTVGLGGRDVAFQQVMVQENYYMLSGSQHQPMKETFHFYKGPNEEIYCDYIGSQLLKMDFEGGELEVSNGLGQTLLWQRPWKHGSPPQQSMEVPVVVAQVVGVAEPGSGAGNAEAENAAWDKKRSEAFFQTWILQVIWAFETFWPAFPTWRAL